MHPYCLELPDGVVIIGDAVFSLNSFSSFYIFGHSAANAVDKQSLIKKNQIIIIVNFSDQGFLFIK